MRVKARPRAPLRTASNAVGVESDHSPQAGRRPAPIEPHQPGRPISRHVPPRRDSIQEPTRIFTGRPAVTTGGPQSQLEAPQSQPEAPAAITGRPLAGPRRSTRSTFLGGPLSPGRPCQGLRPRKLTSSPWPNATAEASNGPATPATLAAEGSTTPGPDWMGPPRNIGRPTVRARRRTILLRPARRRDPLRGAPQPRGHREAGCVRDRFAKIWRRRARRRIGEPTFLTLVRAEPGTS